MIVLASDHAGFVFKEKVKNLLSNLNLKYLDCGTFSTESCDYPDYAKEAAKTILEGKCNKGIAICGSGIGMSIALNRFKGIHAALCLDEDMAVKSRVHNNSNVLVIAERITPWIIAEKMVKVWLSTEFEGGRHLKRVEKLDLF